MARVANTLPVLAKNSLEYIVQQIDQAIGSLSDAEDLVRKLTIAGNFSTANITAFKNDKIQAAKDSNTNALKMYRWLITELSLTLQTAYSDAQVDLIDPEIRTHEQD